MINDGKNTLPQQCNIVCITEDADNFIIHTGYAKIPFVGTSETYLSKLINNDKECVYVNKQGVITLEELCKKLNYKYKNISGPPGMSKEKM